MLTIHVPNFLLTTFIALLLYASFDMKTKMMD